MPILKVSTEYLRAVIEGKIAFKKCLICDESGIRYSDRNGTPLTPAEVENDPDAKRSSAEVCDNCEGLAYVESVNNS